MHVQSCDTTADGMAGACKSAGVSLFPWDEEHPDGSRCWQHGVPFKGDRRGSPEVTHLQHYYPRCPQIIHRERSNFYSRQCSFGTMRGVTLHRLYIRSPKALALALLGRDHPQI